jgi:cellulose synthase/poly-beta-1,6-N-acetylglucosamine synthase-like glycosyltransferase
MQVRYCPDAELWQEGVETMESLLRQRSRWAEGFVKCLFDYFVSLLFSPIGLVKKFDGFITLTRVLMPFFIWIAYIFTVVALYQGVSLTCAPVIPPWLFVSATWIFFITLFAAFYRFNASSVANTAWRIARYWLYNFAVWTLAVPIGFYNGLKNLNTVAWDKTFHRGESVYAHPVGKAGYALSMEMVPEKTN